MKAIIISFFMMCVMINLSANDLVIHENDNLVIPAKMLTQRISSIPTTSKSIQKKPDDYLFIVTKSDLAYIGELMVFLFIAFGTWFKLNNKVENNSKELKSIKKTTDDHEERIRKNEDQQQHFASKEALKEEIAATQQLKEMNSALSKVIGTGDEK